MMSILISNESHCVIPNVIRWMYFQYDNCVQIIVEPDEYSSKCIKALVDQLHRKGVAIYQKSVRYINTRNILKDRKTNCETFLLVTDKPQDWIEQITQLTDKNRRIFYPFSRLYFLSLYRTDLQFIKLVNYLNINVIFGYEFVFDVDSNIIAIRDLLSNFTTKSRPIVADLSHPFIDTENNKKIFNVSCYNCFPNVIYLNENGSKKDGIEYRFLTNVFKNWQIKFLHQNESNMSFNRYSQMFSQLAQGSSQLVMCGIWFHDPKTNVDKDFASYFVDFCNTLVAPKPMKVDSAKLIYLTLSSPVWMLYALSFVVTVVALTIISKIQEKISEIKIYTSNFGRCLLEATSLATWHGVVNIPDQPSIKILFNSWIILSLLVGLGYTTIYTSRLTNPIYTRPINTYEDFADNGLSWLSQRNQSYGSILKQMRESGNAALNKISKGFIQVNSSLQFEEMLKTRLYGFFMCIQTRHAFDVEKLKDSSLWEMFRFMKTCYYSYYTSFALAKHSPYTPLLNLHIKRYQESGIIIHWYEKFYRDQHWDDKLFDLYINTSNEPTSLTIWNMAGAFLILILGLTFSSFACFMELVL